MTDRMALLESALDSLPDGILLLDAEGEVAFCNQAAQAITGYSSAELLAQPLPKVLLPLLNRARIRDDAGGAAAAGNRGALTRARHKLGHELAVIARTVLLRNGLGESVGTGAWFHPAERLDALPRGESATGGNVEESQTEMGERLQSEFEDFERGGQALGVLWIAVDQERELRKTHGAAACEDMIEKVRHALAAGLRPAEELGRWGEDEFLVIAHERTPEMLAGRGFTLAGLARTADFRWWGDRLSLTVSVGAAQADAGESLERLLKRAREAMLTSARESGNRVHLAHRRMEAMEQEESSGMDCEVRG